MVDGIIDAHMHYFRQTPETLSEVEQDHLRCGIALSIAMGTGGVPGRPGVPDGVVPPWSVWCAGIDSSAIGEGEALQRQLSDFRHALQESRCVGLKMYCGYHYFYPHDPRHIPFLELAEEMDLPVVLHCGDTAGSRGKVRYAHPLEVDELAMNFPRVRFVIAHFGNPWIVDAAEVAAKNDNVFLDLSGLVEGPLNLAEFQSTYRAYLDHLKLWITYLGDSSKFLYGSDWPLTGNREYIQLMAELMPEKWHGDFFRNNAMRVFPKIGDFLTES